MGGGAGVPLPGSEEDPQAANTAPLNTRAPSFAIPRTRCAGRGPVPDAADFKTSSIDPSIQGLASMGVTSLPIPSISISTTSPGMRYSGGLRARPTPSGVPVAITSPG